MPKKTKNYFFACQRNSHSQIQTLWSSHSWSRFLSKFNSKCLESPKQVFMTEINFFVTKKNFGYQRLKRFFDFSKKWRHFEEELRYSVGPILRWLSGKTFSTPQMPKKTKNYFFALEVAKQPFSPAKAESSRRVLRTTSSGRSEQVGCKPCT